MTLYLRNMHAENVPVAANKASVYVLMTYGLHTFQTTVCKSNNPKFDDEIQIRCDGTYDKLSLVLYNKAFWGDEELCGYMGLLSWSLL